MLLVEMEGATFGMPSSPSSSELRFPHAEAPWSVLRGYVLESQTMGVQ